MPRTLVVAAALIGFLTFTGNAAAQQDVVTVMSVTAEGPTVDVPVFIRDVSGTPLGIDRPAGSKIQAFSIRVLYSPASAVSSVTFSRAGITSSLTPVFETSPSGPGTISLLESFQESSNPIPFNLNAPPPGDYVAHDISRTGSHNFYFSQRINLTIDALVVNW